MFQRRLIHFGIMQMTYLDEFVVQKRGTLL